MVQFPEPSDEISPKAITIWRLRDGISGFIQLLIFCSILYAYYYFNWYNWIGIVLYIIIGYILLFTIYKATLYPIYLYKTWRYDINEHHIQIKYGYFHRYHFIIPITRVEYVNTNQGPLLRKYKLASITIGTITSNHHIPALSTEEAQALRNKIAYLANLDEPVNNCSEASDSNE